MAKLIPFLPLRGSIGNLTCYTTKDGKHIIQTKGGPSGRRVRTAPEFIRTRENAREFGLASTTAAMLRRAFAMPFPGCERTGTQNRLVQALVPVIKADSIHARGERDFQPDNLRALNGFQWNPGCPLHEEKLFTAIVDGGRLMLGLDPYALMLYDGAIVTLAVVPLVRGRTVGLVQAYRTALLPFADGNDEDSYILSCEVPPDGLYLAGLGVSGPAGTGMVLWYPPAP